MESFSRFNMGFEEDDEDEEEFGKRECSSKKELTLKLDGKSNEQKASTPRLKHSAIEQRRRSKINDRFQMLIGLLPNSDQKRDKASFLLEVIEYIQFLQEKVQMYESISPGSDENTRLMLLNNRNGSGDPMDDPQVFKNGASSGLLVSDNSIPASSQPNFHSSVGRGIFLGQPLQRFLPEADSMVSQSESEWLRSSFPVDCTVSNYVFNEQEELTIDEGTICASNTYSQGLLNTLSQSLQNSGIDLSQANISVHINLGRRTASRHNTSMSIATSKDQDEPSSCNLIIGQARVGNRSHESDQAATKRHKSDHIVTHL
ncbi:hypothetical protein IEQ34_010341 [Dendrobium chrysotoxum]|uniref:BHLH domain-containing protein n=1 Tax=Dendrobium chrysotoxum TaxID=161865 RepID=A0AAV7H108_DENCH|nr:hypothetical protein IEQ34_010341 [Dendrobium chrysotoxum]